MGKSHIGWACGCHSGSTGQVGKEMLEFTGVLRRDLLAGVNRTVCSPAPWNYDKIPETNDFNTENSVYSHLGHGEGDSHGQGPGIWQCVLMKDGEERE